ncbi:MAG: DUF4831 family protein [Muribaculaceae bacterium]|nr:DUF4831 family protein [Muribaculaceae bacterium]
MMRLTYTLRRAAAILALALAMIPAANAQQTKVLTADKHNEYGLVYSLPVTALRVTVTAECETLIAGPYANYAKKYLAASDPIMESGEKWRITDVKVEPFGAVDRESSYLMQLKPGALTYMGVAADGMLLSINRAPAEQAAPAPAPEAEEPERYSGKEYLQYVDEDFIASQSKAKQAQMLAENLMEVRDSYLSLTRGTADTMPVDGRQLELMLASLREQQRAMTAAFTGCSYKETVTRTFTYIPEENGTETLLRFSDFKGFCAPTDYAGAPVDISVNITAEGHLPVDANGKEKEMPKDAVRYAIPGAARVTLAFAGRQLYADELEFAQFGCVFGLNPSIFTDKKQPSYAVFSNSTGALEELGVMPRD